MDIQYIPGPSAQKTGREKVVAVNAFRDVGSDTERLGEWTRPKGRVDTFMSSKPVDHAVSKAI
jgi:hypothetical protein